MDKKKIERINFLARKSRTEELSVKEKEEQNALRREYIEEFKSSLRKSLDNIEYTD